MSADDNRTNPEGNTQYAPLPVMQQASMVNNAPKQDEAAVQTRIEQAAPIMDEILAEDLAVE